MAKVITFSRKFPSYHPKAGQPTYFVEKLLKSINPSKIQGKLIVQDALNIFSSEVYLSCNPKKHTIRSGNRWKVGDKFSPRVWSDRPYKSKQIILYDDVEIKSVYNFKITTEADNSESDWSFVEFLGANYTAYGYGGYDDKIMTEIAENDGLTISDFYDWFLTGRTKQQRLDNESKIFEGQIICWDDTVSY